MLQGGDAICCPICSKNFGGSSLKYHLKSCAKKHLSQLATCQHCGRPIRKDEQAEHSTRCRERIDSRRVRAADDGELRSRRERSELLRATLARIEDGQLCDIDSTGLFACASCRKGFDLLAILPHEEVCSGRAALGVTAFPPAPSRPQTTALQAAFAELRQEVDQALIGGVLERLRDVVQNACLREERKYQKLRCSNAAFEEAIGRWPAAVRILEAVGFEPSLRAPKGGEPEAHLVLPERLSEDTLHSFLLAMDGAPPGSTAAVSPSWPPPQQVVVDGSMLEECSFCRKLFRFDRIAKHETRCMAGRDRGMKKFDHIRNALEGTVSECHIDEARRRSANRVQLPSLPIRDGLVPRDRFSQPGDGVAAAFAASVAFHSSTRLAPLAQSSGGYPSYSAGASVPYNDFASASAPASYAADAARSDYGTSAASTDERRAADPPRRKSRDIGLGNRRPSSRDGTSRGGADASARTRPRSRDGTARSSSRGSLYTAATARQEPASGSSRGAATRPQTNRVPDDAGSVAAPPPVEWPSDGQAPLEVPPQAPPEAPLERTLEAPPQLPPPTSPLHVVQDHVADDAGGEYAVAAAHAPSDAYDIDHAYHEAHAVPPPADFTAGADYLGDVAAQAEAYWTEAPNGDADPAADAYSADAPAEWQGGEAYTPVDAYGVEAPEEAYYAAAELQPHYDADDPAAAAPQAADDNGYGYTYSAAYDEGAAAGAEGAAEGAAESAAEGWPEAEAALEASWEGAAASWEAAAAPWEGVVAAAEGRAPAPPPPPPPPPGPGYEDLEVDVSDWFGED